MARASSKAELIQSANEQFDKMWNLIDKMGIDMQRATFAKEMAAAGKEAHWNRDKNLRDVLVHLHEWHLLLRNWIVANRNGERRPFLPEPYNWKTYPQMNVEFWKKHQDTPLANAMAMLKKSHQDTMALIMDFSNDELFSKGAFDWTGTSTLGAYCISATASHYNWAMKKIKLHIKLSAK
ncbi:MAG: ClbS/DfsB family four-helix bundle protein [Bacteroidales bacterium]|nr:ClbS/DfsB family four-helix bundle protein [Bacteroidales bacterium]